MWMPSSKKVMYRFRSWNTRTSSRSYRELGTAYPHSNDARCTQSESVQCCCHYCVWSMATNGIWRSTVISVYSAVSSKMIDQKALAQVRLFYWDSILSEGDDLEFWSSSSSFSELTIKGMSPDGNHADGKDHAQNGWNENHQTDWHHHLLIRYLAIIVTRRWQ